MCCLEIRDLPKWCRYTKWKMSKSCCPSKALFFYFKGDETAAQSRHCCWRCCCRSCLFPPPPLVSRNRWWSLARNISRCSIKRRALWDATLLAALETRHVPKLRVASIAFRCSLVKKNKKKQPLKLLFHCRLTLGDCLQSVHCPARSAKRNKIRKSVTWISCIGVRKVRKVDNWREEKYKTFVPSCWAEPRGCRVKGVKV